VPFRFEQFDLPGVIIVQPQFFPDERGGFMETYRYSQFAEAGITDPLVQFNISWSTKGVVRGLHYQVEPDAQGKLVSAIEGEIYDVIVAVRRDSPHYGQWRAVNLSSKDHTMLFVPPGYAHGFCVVSETAQVSYGTTAEYAPESERGVLWSDPSLAIPWPVEKPIVSAKDQMLPCLEPPSTSRPPGDSTATT
jgi:dTDP-4-dehydrorhamnose 3,5-epimerase